MFGIVHFKCYGVIGYNFQIRLIFNIANEETPLSEESQLDLHCLSTYLLKAYHGSAMF